MVKANQVMALPSNETTCPNQIAVKAVMPVGEVDFMWNYYTEGMVIMILQI